MSKALKIIAIVLAIAAAIAAIYVIVTKVIKKNQNTSEENYVSCSCEEEFASEAIA